MEVKLASIQDQNDLRFLKPKLALNSQTEAKTTSDLKPDLLPDWHSEEDFLVYKQLEERQNDLEIGPGRQISLEFPGTNQISCLINRPTLN